MRLAYVLFELVPVVAPELVSQGFVDHVGDKRPVTVVAILYLLLRLALDPA